MALCGTEDPVSLDLLHIHIKTQRFHSQRKPDIPHPAQNKYGYYVLEETGKLWWQRHNLCPHFSEETETSGSEPLPNVASSTSDHSGQRWRSAMFITVSVSLYQDAETHLMSTVWAEESTPKDMTLNFPQIPPFVAWRLYDPAGKNNTVKMEWEYETLPNPTSSVKRQRVP